MSVRRKLILIVFGALVLNLLLLLGCYNLFVSDRMANHFDNMQKELDQKTVEICRALSDAESAATLGSFAQEDGHLALTLETLDGHILAQTVAPEGAALYLNAVAGVTVGGDACILRATKYVPVDTASRIVPVRMLLHVEIVLICLIIALASAAIYLWYVRPLEQLKQFVLGYRMEGRMPPAAARRDEIGQLQNAFSALAEELAEEKRLQTRMIASISHDIKTPLTSVMGYAEQLKKKKLPPERQEKYIGILYAKARTIRDIIDEFDEYLSCNLESSLKLRRVTADEIMQMLRDDYEEELAGTLAVRCACPDAVTDADMVRLRRVFDNLIMNSRRHACERPLRIEAGCIEERGRLAFSVADNGCGVEEESLEHIFDPLYSTDAGRRVAGLGLAICREIICAHGGTIHAENNTMGGLTVRFFLPLAAEGEGRR